MLELSLDRIFVQLLTMSDGEKGFLRLLDDYEEAYFSTMLKGDDHFETMAEQLENKGMVKINKRYRVQHYDLRDHQYVARLNSLGRDAAEALRIIDHLERTGGGSNGAT